MSAAQHTPGPWSAERSPLNDSNVFMAVSAGDRGDVVYVTLRQIEVEANAHLIAAAPELLAAARRALAVLKATGESVRSGNALGALDAAIAKAEGRS